MYLNYIDSFAYERMSVAIKKAMDYLKQNDFSKIEDGKYEIDGDKIFAIVARNKTKLSAMFEKHNTYTDIQYMVDGEEYIYYASANNNPKLIEDKMKEKDIAFYEDIKDNSRILLSKGMAIVIFPHEYHKPSMSTSNTEEKVLKVVIKIHKSLI